MSFIKDEDEVRALVFKDPYNFIEFGGVFRTHEFLETMLHRVPETQFVGRKSFVLEYCKGNKNIKK